MKRKKYSLLYIPLLIMSSEKSSGFFIKTSLAIFYGLNFPFEILKEVGRKFSGHSKKKDEKDIIHSELEDYNKLFCIILLIPILYTIFLILVPSNKWFFAILLFSIIQIITLTILSLKSTNFYYFNANIIKILEEYENIFSFAIIDILLSILFLGLTYFEVIRMEFRFRMISLIFLTSLIVFSSINLYLLKIHKKKFQLDISKYLNLLDYFSQNPHFIPDLEDVITKIEKIALEAKNANIDYLVKLSMNNLKEKYQKLIHLYQTKYQKDKIKNKKKEYRQILKLLKG